MKLVLIADTHERQDQVIIPPCDVLVHAGDLTFRGDYESLHKAIEWLKRQPAEHIVFVAGNHDWLFEKDPETAKVLVSGSKRLNYLENSGVTIDGVKFWGSPVTPRFMDWAFNCDRADIDKYWNLIPDDTDVLITHGPPQNILDLVTPTSADHLGCYDLRQAVKRVEPKIHVFGHLHGGHGFAERENTKFYNASVVNEAYKVVHPPYEVEI